MARKKDITDLPMITSKQAAVIFGCGHDKFKLKFAQVLHEEIISVNGAHSRVYLLTDVLRSAFPEANDHTIHMMALEANYRHAAERKERWGRKARAERRKDEET